MSVGAIGIAAGAGLQAYSRVQAGRVAASQGKARKDIALYNQRQLERSAVARQQAARFDDARLARRARIALGSSIAKSGKSGVVGNQPSIADMAYQFAIDRNLSLRQGLVESEGLKTKGRLIAAEGQYANRIGKLKQRGAFMKAGASILSGGYATYKALPGGTPGGTRTVQSSHFRGTFGGQRPYEGFA